MLSQFLRCLLVLLVGQQLALGASTTLSLDDAIELALKNNRNISVAKLGVTKAESQVREAYGTALPSVSVAAGFNHNIQLPVFFFPNPVTGEVAPLRFGLTNGYNVTTQVQQILFNSSVITAISASQLYSDAAEAQLKAAIAEVVTETKKRYYQAVAASGYATVAEATLSNIIELQRNITALFNEGLVAEFDKIRADVAVANAQPMVVQAKSVRYASLAALQTYIGMNLNDSITVSEDVLSGAGDTPNPEEALELAMRENLDLRALEQQIEVGKRMVDLSRADYYPTLAAFGQWQSQGQSDTFNDWRSATSTVVGLSFSMNVFNGLRTNEKVEQASIDVRTALERMSQVRDLIHLQIRTVINQLESARLRIQAQKTTVDQAQRGFDIAKVRYKEGTGSLLEITDAETSLAQAKVNAINALVDYHVTRADYDRSVGRIDPKYFRMVAK